MLLLVALCVAGVWAADPSNKATFHDTHHLLWKDCGDSNAWLQLTAFDVTPGPLHIPGHGTVTIHGQNGNTAFDKNVALVVDMKKFLLGLWSSIPCTGPTTPTDQRLGSCTYHDPCDFMSTLFPAGSCPAIFNQQGLPCTCPFTIPAHKNLTVNNEAVTFAAPRPDLTWLTTGEYYIKLAMYETGQAIARMCLEFYVNLSH